MFEKEAEERANKKLCSERICYNHCNFNSPKHHRCGEWHRIYECAKESAEFGYNKAFKAIAELEKENAELKSKNCWKTCEYAEPKSQWISQHIQDVVQLTKAKKIIRNCLNLYNNVMTEETVRALIKEAEQFIREVEKCRPL